MYHHTMIVWSGELQDPEVRFDTSSQRVCIDLDESLSCWLTVGHARELVAALCGVIPIPLFPEGTEPWPDRKQLLDGAE